MALEKHVEGNGTNTFVYPGVRAWEGKKHARGQRDSILCGQGCGGSVWCVWGGRRGGGAHKQHGRVSTARVIVHDIPAWGSSSVPNVPDVCLTCGHET